MITKDEYLNQLKKEGLNQFEYDRLVEGLAEYNFEETADVTLQVYASMPGMGIMSIAKRFNCFMAVCRHTDTFVKDEQIDEAQAQTVLDIVRMKNPKFLKAMAAFTIMASRMDSRETAALPETAYNFLKSMTRSNYVDDHGNPV